MVYGVSCKCLRCQGWWKWWHVFNTIVTPSCKTRTDLCFILHVNCKVSWLQGLSEVLACLNVVTSSCRARTDLCSNMTCCHMNCQMSWSPGLSEVLACLLYDHVPSSSETCTDLCLMSRELPGVLVTWAF
jgi:hypothetical protein